MMEPHKTPERREIGGLLLLDAGFGDHQSSLRYELVCPFCKETVIAYRWSLHGSGKRCGCGVLLTAGAAYRDDRAEKIANVLNLTGAPCDCPLPEGHLGCSVHPWGLR